MADPDPIEKWSVASLQNLARTLNKLRREKGLQPTINVKDWLSPSGYWSSQGGYTGISREDVCHALHQQRLRKRHAGENFGARTSLFVALRLGCHGGMRLEPSERYIIVRSVETYWKPGVPIDIDFWLEAENADDLRTALESFSKKGTVLDPARGTLRADAQKLSDKLFKGQRPAGPKQTKKAKSSRIVDFFFPPERS